nr:acyl-CoA reductase [Parafrankia soli]
MEGDLEQVDRFCELLCAALGEDREFASAVGPKPPAEIREAVDGLRYLEPDYRVWGEFDGRGLVVRSLEPVDFHPTDKTVNVLPVRSIVDAARYATVATQTVGVFPTHRKAEVRYQLATAGVQRVVWLGNALSGSVGIRTTACIRCTGS